MKYRKEILIIKLRKMDLTTLADKLEDGCNSFYSDFIDYSYVKRGAREA